MLRSIRFDVWNSIEERGGRAYVRLLVWLLLSSYLFAMCEYETMWSIAMCECCKRMYAVLSFSLLGGMYDVFAEFVYNFRYFVI